MTSNQPPAAPRLAAAAVMVREDGQLLLVRYADDGAFAGRWGLPVTAVPDELTAEEALTSLLRDGLHVEPGPSEFVDTIYLVGGEGGRFIVNAFTCVGWQGEPRFEGGAFVDAGWIHPAAPGALDLMPEIASWLADQYSASGGGDLSGESLDALLAQARADLLAILDGIPSQLHGDALGELGAEGSPAWTPLDVLAHVAEVEGYYLAEVQRLLHEPGRTWRPFNDDQWGDIRRLRPTDDDEEVRHRADFVRAETRAWLGSVTAEQLAAYGNHAERGVVQVAGRIAKVAEHDREHLETLQRMAEAATLIRGGGT